MSPALRPGLGVGWRAELALAIDRWTDLNLVEVVAEDLDPRHLPQALLNLRERDVPVVVHGVGLSLGSAAPPDPRRLAHLARLAERLGSPLVSEHIAFVRAGGVESGHLLPVERRREQLERLVENVAQAQAALPVPLALENIACLFEWPGAELDEADYLVELLRQTGAPLLLDLANLHANARNLGVDPPRFLERLAGAPIAYVHVAGGVEREGRYHDTHAHAVPAAVLDLVEETATRRGPLPLLLERDDRFPPAAELRAELDAISAAQQRGLARGRLHAAAG